MKIEQSKVTKLHLTELDNLDPVTVYLEDYELGKGRITIECYGESWTTYFNAMGKNTLSVFIPGCDKHYLMGRFAHNIDEQIIDMDKLQEEADEKGVLIPSDEPWKDSNFMNDMYSLVDPYGWWDCLPKKTNPEYMYVCRIIEAVKKAMLKNGCVNV